jgi:mono/diheme cytochrome c family protein
MKFVAGFITAIVVMAVGGVLVIFTGAFNVAATAPDTSLERTILHAAMRYSVRSHAAEDVHEASSDDRTREGFQEYNEMCVGCHGAPGGERSEIGKGLRPEPPNLAEISRQWSTEQLFWIIKSGIRMTGMSAFGLKHRDDQIRNIVGFVQRLEAVVPLNLGRAFMHRAAHRIVANPRQEKLGAHRDPSSWSASAKRFRELKLLIRASTAEGASVPPWIASASWVFADQCPVHVPTKSASMRG